MLLLLSILPALFYIRFIANVVPKNTIQKNEEYLQYLYGFISIPILYVLWVFKPITDLVFNIPIVFIDPNWDHELLYCFFSVALYEEIAKFLLFRSTRIFFEKQTPLSSMVLCGVSALGFATIENFSYIATDINCYMVRIIYTYTMHLFTGLVVGYFYGRTLGNRKTKNNNFLRICMGLFMAMIFHSFFNFSSSIDIMILLHIVMFFIVYFLYKRQYKFNRRFIREF